MKTYNHTWLIAEWERMGRPEVQVLIKAFKPAWMDDEEPDFNPIFQYRIKSKPSINWEHVSEEFNFLVSGSDASLLYANIPKKFSTTWLDGGHYCLADAFTSFTTGTCDWRDSLVMRPVVIGETK
jgi:hypothetical protein